MLLAMNCQASQVLTSSRDTGLAFVSSQPRRHADSLQQSTAQPLQHQTLPNHRKRPIAAATPTNQDTTTIASAQQQNIWTMEDLEAFALTEGVELSKTTLGPGFRTVARSTQNSSNILGYGEGFVRPAGYILHLDKMEVFQKMVTKVRRDDPQFRGGGSTFGVGLLFGYLCLLHGKENGCTEAEFLAIDDEDFQHKRLVRFYKYTGFKVIKYIGEDFQDIPARMVWGGCGTLMRANIDDLLPLWTSILSRSSSASNEK